MSSASPGSGEEITVAAGPHADKGWAALAHRLRGTTLLRYLVIEEIGRGGMGVVLRAYDAKLQREVALKVLRTGAMSSDARARMTREARAMAKLSHPNVVAVYDVELEADELVLSMEFVAGTTLRQWIKGRERDWRAVVPAFVEAGRGLSAAHAKGLVHRDFKPSNVLVTPAADGGLGRVCVTDFGLARSEAGESPRDLSKVSVSEGTSSDELTEQGVVLGTPRYMAPEQHESASVGAAADQYALCVALWEALAGYAPFTGSSLARAKAEGPPIWPKSVSVPPRIIDALARGLHPDPSKRWPGVEELLSKLVGAHSRAHRWWVAALGVATVGAVVGVRGSVPDAEPCTGAEVALHGVWDDGERESVRAAVMALKLPFAGQTLDRVEERLDTYSADWRAMHTETCLATTVRAEQTSVVMDLKMTCLHRARVDLDAAVGVLAVADADVLREADHVVAGLPSLERCADVRALWAEVPPPGPADALLVEWSRSVLATARFSRKAGKYDQALTEATKVSEAIAGLSYGPVRTETRLELGLALDHLGEYEAAESALREVLRMGAKWGQWAEVGEAAGRLVVVVGYRQARTAEGLAFAGPARGLAQRVGDPMHEVQLLNNLAAVHQSAGMLTEAEADLRSAQAQLSAVLGPRHPDVAIWGSNLGSILDMQGEYDEAHEVLRSALTLADQVLGPEHPETAQVRSNLATVLHAQRRVVEAEHLARAALESRVAALGPDHPDVAVSRNNLAMLLYDQKAFAESEEQQRASVRILEQHLGVEHPLVLASRTNLADVMEAQGKYDEAEAQFRLTLMLYEKSLPPDHPDIAIAHNGFALFLVDRGRVSAALPLLERAWKIRRFADVPPESRGETAFALARVLWDAGGDRARARKLASLARRAFVDAGELCAEDRADIDAWLDDHR